MKIIRADIEGIVYLRMQIVTNVLEWCEIGNFSSKIDEIGARAGIIVIIIITGDRGGIGIIGSTPVKRTGIGKRVVHQSDHFGICFDIDSRSRTPVNIDTVVMDIEKGDIGPEIDTAGSASRIPEATTDHIVVDLMITVG